MTDRTAIAIEVACVFVIAAGIAVIYWPAALIVGGLLLLVGMQGIRRRGDETVSE